MTVSEQLLTASIDIWTSAETEKKSGRGRGAKNAASIYGIKKLRELILELAVLGKLVPQDARDEPASSLLNRIYTEKNKLIADGKIKRDSTLPQLTEQDLPFVIPPTWEWVRLGEITNFGSTVKLSSLNNDVWVLDLEDIEKDTSKVFQKFRFSERTALSDKNYFQKGDVLYGKLRPYLNKVIVADEDGVCTTEILPFRCYGPFNSNYFKVALKSRFFLNFVNERSYGMKMPRLGTKDGRSAPFPLAPLAEQCRIVAKVDELMALCDQLETQQRKATNAHEQLVTQLLSTLTQSPSTIVFNSNWKRLAANFDTLFTTESSIDSLITTLLQLAVMGKLVEQDANDEPASVLLLQLKDDTKEYSDKQKISLVKPEPISEKDLPRIAPNGWQWTRLSSIFRVITDGDHQPPPQVKEGVFFLTIGNLSKGGIDFSESRFVPRKYFDSIAPYRKPEFGDILYTVVGASYGRPIPVNTEEEFCVQRHVAIMKRSKYLNFKFAKFLLSSPDIFDQATHATTGTAQPTIPLKPLRNFLVSLPPLAEQYRIVEKLEELIGICESLKYQLVEREKLRRSLADIIF